MYELLGEHKSQLLCSNYCCDMTTITQRMVTKNGMTIWIMVDPLYLIATFLRSKSWFTLAIHYNSDIYLSNESNLFIRNRKMKSFDCKLILNRLENPIYNLEVHDLVISKWFIKISTSVLWKEYRKKLSADII